MNQQAATTLLLPACPPGGPAPFFSPGRTLLGALALAALHTAPARAYAVRGRAGNRCRLSSGGRPTSECLCAWNVSGKCNMLHATALARALRPGTLSKGELLSLVYSVSQPVQIMLRGRFCVVVHFKTQPRTKCVQVRLHPCTLHAHIFYFYSIR